MKTLILIACTALGLAAADLKPEVASLQAQLNATLKRAATAELRAAVAEEKLAAIPHNAAVDKAMVAFHAACEISKIPQDKCEPDPSDWSVRVKAEPPAPAPAPVR